MSSRWAAAFSDPATRTAVTTPPRAVRGAPNTCRARQFNLFGQSQRQSMRVGRLGQPDTYDLGAGDRESVWIGPARRHALSVRAEASGGYSGRLGHVVRRPPPASRLTPTTHCIHMPNERRRLR